MGTSRPRVSICIPSYNSARFLPQAIESVLAQRCPDYELLIIDDASDDGTREIAARYASLDDRIVLSVNDRNLGMVENWNRCLSRARGDYIKFLFGDDLLADADAIGLMAARLDADDGVSLVGSARYVIDNQGRTLQRLSCFRDRAEIDGKALIARCLGARRNPNLIGEPSTVMFRKAQAGRGFDPGYRQLVDLEMWFHLLEQGRYAHIGQALTSFRMHPGQQTAKNLQNLAYLDDLTALYGSYLGKEYVGFGFCRRRFLEYFQYYKVWKKSRQNRVDRGLAWEKITSRYRPWVFFALIPWYKTYGPCVALRELMGRQGTDCGKGTLPSGEGRLKPSPRDEA